MNDNSRLPRLLGVHDDPGAAARLPDSEGHLGRRVEMDGSWTMYHVFTGVPARVNNRIMTGLTRCEVTAVMVRRNAGNTIK